MLELRRVVPWCVVLPYLMGYAAVAQPMTNGARSGALAGATTAIDGDLWNRANPAGHATVPRPGISFFTSQGFGLAELRLGSVAALFPTRYATLNVSAQTYGFSQYRENQFRGGIARTFYFPRDRVLYAGLDATHYSVRIEGYGSASTVGLSTGLLTQLTPSLWAGIAVQNVNAPAFSDADDIGRSVSVGLMYRPYERIRVLADVQREDSYPYSFRAGFEAKPVPALSLRAGVATNPVRFATGAGIRAGAITADVATERHDVLGWTPGIAVGVQW